MPANSETILSEQVHPGDGEVTTVTGDKYKGDGYYGRADGLHTIQVAISEFTGKIEVQGTLEVDPQESDWFTITLGSSATSFVDTTGLVTSLIETDIINYSNPNTSVNTYNFTGNYVWIRAKVTNWTEGGINSVILNH